MNNTLREHLLACAEARVNALAEWTHEQPAADLEAREQVVLEQGRALQRELPALVAAATTVQQPAIKTTTAQ